MDWVQTKLNFLIILLSISNIKFIYDIQKNEWIRIYNNYILREPIIIDLFFMFLFTILFFYNTLLLFINYKRYILFIKKNNNLINITINDVVINIYDFSDNDICSICLDNYNIENNGCKMKKCTHIYHINCIKTWFESSKTLSCPLCR
jgi:hypothetical protein